MYEWFLPGDELRITQECLGLGLEEAPSFGFAGHLNAERLGFVQTAQHGANQAFRLPSGRRWRRNRRFIVRVVGSGFRSMATLRISCTMDLQSTKSGAPYHKPPGFLY